MRKANARKKIRAAIKNQQKKKKTQKKKQSKQPRKWNYYLLINSSDWYIQFGLFLFII